MADTKTNKRRSAAAKKARAVRARMDAAREALKDGLLAWDPDPEPVYPVEEIRNEH
jgi:hypothetical protein